VSCFVGIFTVVHVLLFGVINDDDCILFSVVLQDMYVEDDDDENT